MENSNNLKLHLKISIYILILFLVLYFIIYIFADSFILILYTAISILLIISFLTFVFLKNSNYQEDMYIFVEQILKINKSLSDLNDTLYTLFNNLLNKVTGHFKNGNEIYENPVISNNIALYSKLKEKKDYLNNINYKNYNNIHKLISNGFFKTTEDICTNVLDYQHLIKDANGGLLNDLTKLFNGYEKKDLFNSMILEFSIQSDIILNFLNAIVSDSSKTGDDVSGQILEIRKKIDIFIKDISTWKDNFLNNSSDINFDRLMQTYEVQKTKYVNISGHVTKNYNEVSKTLSSLTVLVENIFENIHYITDIIESINILSINASIEAARAGEQGKGFRKISNEIKKLSNNTKIFVGKIIENIKEAKNISALTTHQYEKNEKNIIEEISFLNNDVKESYNMLDIYYTNFKSMIHSMESLTEEINLNIDQFSIILQYFDIEGQQLNNLTKIINSNTSEYSKSLESISYKIKSSEKINISRKLLESTNNTITTKLESEIIDQLYIIYGIINTNKKKIVEKNIELF